MEHVQQRKSLWTVVLMLFLAYLTFGTRHFQSREFTREESCNLQERIENNCAELKHGIFDSIVSCNVICQGGCTGVVWQNHSNCYVYKPCQRSINCSTADFTFYRKLDPCQNNGIWDVSTDTCKCIDGWVGECCERLPVHCRELREFGYLTSPIIKIWVKLNLDSYHEPVRVRCDISDTYENTMVMWNKGEKFDNNRSRNDYVNGFYNDDFNFWLGLDNIKALNDAGLTHIIMCAGFVDGDRAFTLLQRTFSNFQMSGSSAGYSFTLSPGIQFGSGPYKNLSYGDCLSPLIGAEFSTWDKDNDQDETQNCAAQAGVGWWFKDCNMTCNPMGWSYSTIQGPETKQHIKMKGIDFESKSYAKSSDTCLYFHSRP